MSSNKEKTGRPAAGKPQAGAFTAPGAQGLFGLKKPVAPEEEHPESAAETQQAGQAEEKQSTQQEDNQEGLANEQKEGAMVVQPDFPSASRMTVPPAPHDTSVALQNQDTQLYRRINSEYLKKSAGQISERPSSAPEPQPKTQVVGRRTVKVTIEIYEDQRRAIESMYIERVNNLIDAGVEVDRRKYQESVIYREILDMALSLIQQQKRNR